jgi:hypothetical protein
MEETIELIKTKLTNLEGITCNEVAMSFSNKDVNTEKNVETCKELLPLVKLVFKSECGKHNRLKYAPNLPASMLKYALDNEKCKTKVSRRHSASDQYMQYVISNV